MAERITGADFDKKVKNADGLVLLDFYSDSCIPCKQMSPVLGELEEAYAGKAAVYKVNVSYEEDLSAKYHVMSAPTLILFQDGEPVDRKSGMQKKEVLTEWLDRYLARNDAMNKNDKGVCEK